MKELVKYIVDTLTNGADVSVEYSNDKPNEIVISASKEDIGKVIGKQGRIAKSIRTIVKAASAKQDIKKYYTVSIVEREDETVCDTDTDNTIQSYMTLIIGKILKAQGIKGEVKVMPLTDDINRFLLLKNAYIGDIRHNVENVRIVGEFAYIKFKDIDTRNDAELLSGIYLSVDREDAVKLPEHTWFIADIIGCSVYIDKKIIGTVVDVLQNSTVDVYVVSNDKGKEIMFPALKDLLLNVDIENKKIILDKKRFEEVAVD